MKMNDALTTRTDRYSDVTATSL